MHSFWVEPEAECWFTFAHWLCYGGQRVASKKKIAEIFYFVAMWFNQQIKEE